jgi:hypothetical protein
MSPDTASFARRSIPHGLVHDSKPLPNQFENVLLVSCGLGGSQREMNFLDLQPIFALHRKTSSAQREILTVDSSKSAFPNTSLM